MTASGSGSVSVSVSRESVREGSAEYAAGGIDTDTDTDSDPEGNQSGGETPNAATPDHIFVRRSAAIVRITWSTIAMSFGSCRQNSW